VDETILSISPIDTLIVEKNEMQPIGGENLRLTCGTARISGYGDPSLQRCHNYSISPKLYIFARFHLQSNGRAFFFHLSSHFIFRYPSSPVYYRFDFFGVSLSDKPFEDPVLHYFNMAGGENKNLWGICDMGRLVSKFFVYNSPKAEIDSADLVAHHD
jgi:hypothetical protein